MTSVPFAALSNHPSEWDKDSVNQTDIMEIDEKGPPMASDGPISSTDAMEVDVDLPPMNSAGPVRRRRKKAPTMKARDWEPFKAEIERLYIFENRSLQDVMRSMEHRGLFATKRQYKAQLGVWRFEKNIKRQKKEEMLGMIQQSLTAGGPPPVFYHNGKEIEKQKIARVSRVSRVSRKPTISSHTDRSGPIDKPRLASFQSQDAVESSKPSDITPITLSWVVYPSSSEAPVNQVNSHTTMGAPDARLNPIQGINLPTNGATHVSMDDSHMQPQGWSGLGDLPQNLRLQGGFSMHKPSLKPADAPLFLEPGDSSILDLLRSMELEDKRRPEVPLPRSFHLRNPRFIQRVNHTCQAVLSNDLESNATMAATISPQVLVMLPATQFRLEEWPHEADERTLRQELIILFTTSRETHQRTLHNIHELSIILHSQGDDFNAEYLERRLVSTLWGSRFTSMLAIQALSILTEVLGFQGRVGEAVLLLEELQTLLPTFCKQRSSSSSLRYTIWRTKVCHISDVHNVRNWEETRNLAPNLFADVVAEADSDHQIEMVCDLLYLVDGLQRESGEAFEPYHNSYSISRIVETLSSQSIHERRNDLSALRLNRTLTEIRWKRACVEYKDSETQAQLLKAHLDASVTCESSSHPVHVANELEFTKLLSERGQIKEAYAIARRVLELGTNTKRGFINLNAACLLRTLTKRGEEEGHYEESLSLRKSIYQMVSRSHGKESVQALTDLGRLGRTHRDVGNFNEAITILTRCYTGFQQQLGEEDECTKWAKYLLDDAREQKSQSS